jgi:hypothetical protein
VRELTNPSGSKACPPSRDSYPKRGTAKEKEMISYLAYQVTKRQEMVMLFE